MEKKTVVTKSDKMLRVKLTQDELLDAGQQLADAQQTLTELENELQSFKEQMKGKVAEAEGKATRYGAMVRQKYEYRYVPCDTAKDYASGTIIVQRMDTLELIEDRRMTNDELSVLPMA